MGSLCGDMEKMTNEEEAIKRAYSMLLQCAHNEECGKKTLMSPKGMELTALIQAIKIYAEMYGVNLYDHK